jgi:hypothetical protein
MRAFILVLGALWAIHANCGEPYGQQIINTHTYPADGVTRNYYWPNPTGHVIYIHSARVCLWFTYGLYADCKATLTRVGDGNILVPAGTDHYAMNNTATGNNDDRSFEPYCIYLGLNDSLKLSAYARGFVAPITLKSGVLPNDPGNQVWDNGDGYSTVYNAQTGQTWALNQLTHIYTPLNGTLQLPPLVEQPWASPTSVVQQSVYVWYTKDAP